jgi:two-component system response regulator PfeR
MSPEPRHAPNILVIDDDPVLGACVHEQLGCGGFQVTWCRNGREGLALARGQAFDLVLMDVLLPGMNGLDVLQHLRERSVVPVILMSALSSEADRISGFRHGADDYLPKPFSLDELQVRVEAILRRVALERCRTDPELLVTALRLDGLGFDEALFDVCLGPYWAGLTRSEYRLLETLDRHSEEVLSKPFLYQQVLQRGYAQHDRSLDMHVSQIRRKLKAIGYLARQVRTVWGKGYVLTASAEAV